MADRMQLKAQKRAVFGRKVRALRRTGVLPATVYGHNIEPVSIQMDAHETAGVLRHAGRTQLIDLVIEGEKARPVLVRQTGTDAKRNTIIHIEFFQANLLEKLVSHVALHFVGESQAVRDGGIFLPVMDHVDIESLPQDVPAEGIEVDLTLITEIGGHILASDLTMPPSVTLVTHGEETIAKVDAPVTEEAAAAAEAEAEPAGEQPAAATTESDVPGDE